MTIKSNKHARNVLSLAVASGLTLMSAGLQAEIAATHIYHNHMPNFWPYFDTGTYDGMSVGEPIRYTYDGQVINLKNSPPANYTYFLPDGSPMPHDDLVSYYSHHAKQGAYQWWPQVTANDNNVDHPLSQTHVTMSASVINNTDSLNLFQNVSGYPAPGGSPVWGDFWKEVYTGTKTSNGYNALDLIHFTGHHSMGPLVGKDYFLKDLIYHNVTLAQPYFLGDNFRSSNGFFPTELGFSERLIPTLTKLGIEWSVIGNVHFSRTLKDYPDELFNNPGSDTMVSPPNRADFQNESNVGDWVSINMFNEQQVTHNKFPFASTPHWVQYIDPETGEAHKIAGIPVEQASSWEEGYQGSVTAGPLKPFEGDAQAEGRTQYFVIAHDGDNSQGRAGDLGTWLASGDVTYSDSGVTGKGVDEYLRAHPIPENDIAHVQDGSWIDTRDSSADPTWYHWHLPFCIWKGQFADFNRVNGTDFAPKKNLAGIDEGMTVSFEFGYHYLERNFALLQAAENYAKTAEQIWLDDNPNYWSPSNIMDNEVTYQGNQLNPWMMSYPVKGDPNNNYAGGANPAELAWYFLIASIDSGFGYYDENTDDHLKPTISFNQSLHFSEPYVEANLAKDRTGPSLWWPQRWPYNPGSGNKGKSQGWTLHYYDNNFGIYTYGYDVSNIADIKVKIRTHSEKRADPVDRTYQVYDPVAMKNAGVPNIDPARVSDWVEYDMNVRDLTPDINGVDWQPSTQETMAIVPAQKIGDLYFAYIGDYRDQLLDYYIEATDSKGNVTRSEIQQVYVGAGRYRLEGGVYIEDVNGDVEGTYPFVTDGVGMNRAPNVSITPAQVSIEPGETVTFDGSASTDVDGTIEAWLWSDGSTGQQTTITFPDEGKFDVSLTLTDNEGKQATKTISVFVGVAPEFLSTYDNVFFRGTANEWVAGEMELIADYTWQLTNLVFTGDAEDRFKFDILGDWTFNFGDNDANGTLEQAGGDIMITDGAGFYTVTMNDKELTYSVENVDSDMDGLPTAWEETFGLDPATDDAALDSDQDGLTNLQEFEAGTDPTNNDTDNDGLLDGSDPEPLIPQNGSTDRDNDGMPNDWETTHGLNPDSAADAGLDGDNDGLTNLQEFNAGTLPGDSDTDNDGLLDGSDPNPLVPDNVTDRDNDGMPNDWENTHGLNPDDASDASLDADSDGLTNLAEFQAGTLPNDNDTDSDGLLDGVDPQPLIPANPSATRFDQNGDGKADILWRNVSNGQNWFYMMNGHQIAQGAGFNVVANEWDIAGRGDFNGDGMADILWQNINTGESWVYLMNGSQVSSKRYLAITGSDWSIKAITDLNGDGKADVLWQNSVTGQLWLYLMDGARIASSRPIGSGVSSDWQVLGAGDINGDGAADIIWRNTDTGLVWVYQMSGSQIVASYRLTHVSTDWSLAAIADLNGDGVDDLLWRNSVTGVNWVYLMASGQVATSKPLNTVADMDWTIAMAADMDGNGTDDLVWRHMLSGKNYVYFINNGSVANVRYINTVTDAAWQVK
tara:strand:+ start:204 stop:4742 length:4539 start_codon:yes stop_codon:yes gene_type:complete